jgi:tRNA threonylcarbamoyladenosine biosynthesis protein TsaE
VAALALADCIPESGLILALMGPLGAGKTVFVKGLAEGLGVDPARVTSPTFVIANEYPAPGRLLAHVDLYRIESARELEATGFLDYLEPGAVVAVEWADRFPDALPADRLELRLLRQTGQTGRRADLIRRVEVSAGGEVATQVLRGWRDALVGQPGVQLAEVD